MPVALPKNVDICVIGGGIVGLATAYQLLSRKPGLRIALLDKESRVASHQTGHNSGVIHSGIYYKPGGHKARLCRLGYDSLLAFCQEHRIPYEICGKLIVACDEDERQRLQTIAKRGKANGLKGIRWLEHQDIHKFEPHVRALAALHVPQTGIINYRKVAEKLAQVIQQQGAHVGLGVRVTNISTAQGTKCVQTTRGAIHTKLLVNCGGLQSDRIARMDGVTPGLRIVPFRGDYFRLRDERSALARNLIYPVPDPSFPFLGVHLTRMIEGGVECGPNAVLALKREGYSRWSFNVRDALSAVSYAGLLRLASRHWTTGLGELRRAFSKRQFAASLAKMVPEIQPEDLVWGGCGVRAQAVLPDGTTADDFIFERGEQSLHVLNAPSPAATASLAIGAYIAEQAFAALGDSVSATETQPSPTLRAAKVMA